MSDNVKVRIDGMPEGEFVIGLARPGLDSDGFARVWLGWDELSKINQSIPLFDPGPGMAYLEATWINREVVALYDVTADGERRLLPSKMVNGERLFDMAGFMFELV